MQHDYNDVIKIFNEIFLESYNTQLLLGGDEPLYLPSSGKYPHHRIIFARGFFASAMHEIAHWCVAGPQRRLLEDYGYWYEPDGRSEVVQAKFEEVEIKPQAIEWILSASCGFKFQVSCDNLNGSYESDRIEFTEKVRNLVCVLLDEGFSKRLQKLSDELRGFYGILPLTILDFDRLK